MQVLEYLHVPHDLDVKSTQRQTLLASTKDSDLTDESPDHLGAPLQDDSAPASTNQAATTTAKPASGNGTAQMAAAQHPETKSPAASRTEIAQAAPPPAAPTGQSAANGTVVLDVDSGVVVPSFLGKALRSAVETAQQSGLEINAIGSGVAREQWPAPGSHLASGQHITVRFTH